jgi:hypothetical protein
MVVKVTMASGVHLFNSAVDLHITPDSAGTSVIEQIPGFYLDECQG